MIAFTLAMAAAAATPAASPTKAENKDKLVCRRYEETGSLVRRTRVCRTRAEWARADEDARAEAERLRPGTSTEQGN